MLKGILSISGHSGLFKIVAEAKSSMIVESLTTKKRMPTFSTSKISALEDIAIFTESGDVPLKDILKNIFEIEAGGPSLDPKATGNELKNYFTKVLPDYDKERVYVSDIKKVILWYNILQENELLNFEEEEVKEEGETEGKEEEQGLTESKETE